MVVKYIVYMYITAEFKAYWLPVKLCVDIQDFLVPKSNESLL